MEGPRARAPEVHPTRHPSPIPLPSSPSSPRYLQKKRGFQGGAALRKLASSLLPTVRGEGKGATMESQRYTYKMPLQSPVLIRSRNVLLVRIAHILLKTDASSPALRRMPGLGPEQRSPSLFPCQVLSREPYQSWRILCALFPRPGEKKNGHI